MAAEEPGTLSKGSGEVEPFSEELEAVASGKEQVELGALEAEEPFAALVALLASDSCGC